MCRTPWRRGARRFPVPCRRPAVRRLACGRPRAGATRQPRRQEAEDQQTADRDDCDDGHGATGRDRLRVHPASTVAKQKQVKMQMQVGRPGCDPAAGEPHRRAAAERVEAPRGGEGDPGRPRRGALRRGHGAQVLQRGARGLPPAGAPGAAADDEGLDGARRAPAGRPQGGDGEARPAGPLRSPAVHAADDGAADPAGERGDRGPRARHPAADRARDRAARRRPRRSSS